MKAAIRLQLRIGFRINFLYFGDADAPIQRQRRRRVPDRLLVIGFHPVLLGVVDGDARLVRFRRCAAGKKFRDRISRS
jgi:hypothetical protein